MRHSISPFPDPVASDPAEISTTPSPRPTIRQRVKRFSRRYPWAVSLAVHTVAITGMAMWALPRLPLSSLQTLAAFSDPTLIEPLALVPLVDVIESPADSSDREDRPIDLSASGMFDSSLALSDASLQPSFESLPALQTSSELLSASLDRVSSERLDKDARALRREISGTDGISHAEGVGAALTGIEKAIRGELDQGDTLVVWLMDASISLQLNRQLMAERVSQFYDSIGALKHSNRTDQVIDRYRLFTSVVAFGQGVTEIQRPTPVGAKAIDAMMKVPIDRSGVEMTLTAVDRVVNLYRDRQKRKERLVVVVLSDESGDDGRKLEATIANCRTQGTAVHVIGPTAVMGAQEGSQLWTTTVGGQPYSFLLTVNRGPETCLPERMLLPYWHEASLPAWKPRVRPAVAMPWYGGEYRESVLSGFGPYTLTRLALQTGGTFTLYDGGVGERYDLEKLRQYLPDYGSLADYRAAVHGRPLREFVCEAAVMSIEEGDVFASPRMMFLGQRSPRFPFTPQSVYYSPGDFRARLGLVLTQEVRRGRAALTRIETLIASYQDVSWQSEYGRETSPRWRAWFDLSWGRLLALRARYHEYLAVAEQLRRDTPREVNEIMLIPSGNLRVPETRPWVEEAQSYLDRCVEQNRSTPWADLANWELEKPCGIEVVTRILPMPEPRVAIPGRGGGGPSFSFPAL